MGRLEESENIHGLAFFDYQEKKEKIIDSLRFYLRKNSITSFEQITPERREQMLWIILNATPFFLVKDFTKLLQAEVAVNEKDQKLLETFNGKIVFYFIRPPGSEKVTAHIYSGKWMQENLQVETGWVRRLELPSQYFTKQDLLRWKWMPEAEAYKEFYWQSVHNFKKIKWANLIKLVENEFCDSLIESLLTEK